MQLCHKPCCKSLSIERHIVMPELSKMYILESVKYSECLLCDAAIALLGIYSEELKAYVHTKTCTQMFIAAFIPAKIGSNQVIF